MRCGRLEVGQTQNPNANGPVRAMGSPGFSALLTSGGTAPSKLRDMCTCPAYVSGNGTVRACLMWRRFVDMG